MKRKSKRATIRLSADTQAKLHRLQETILRDEKAGLSRIAHAFRRQQQAAEVELSRAAELLKAERQEQGLSLADIHAKTGRAAICRLENLVDANPTVATLDRMAAALGKKLVIALQDR
jgi:hypothetical protein